MRKTVDQLVKLIQIEKMGFLVQKNQKYLKSKIDLKRPLQGFSKELWAIYVLWNLVKFKNHAPGKRFKKKYANFYRLHILKMGWKSTTRLTRPRPQYLPSGSSESPTQQRARKSSCPNGWVGGWGDIWPNTNIG